jgi:hypothetical protein
VDSMTLIVGARVLVTMSGLGSAGYRWTATIDNPAVLEVVREPAPSAPANRPQSSSRDEQFAVIGLAPGETVVHFRQARSFEPGQPPISARDIAVQVKNCSDSKPARAGASVELKALTFDIIAGWLEGSTRR